MAGYTEKTLMHNERILYSAHGHFFNYATGFFLLFIGLWLTGLVDAKVPDSLRQYAPVQSIERRVDDISAQVGEVQQNVKRRVDNATRGVPGEVKGLAGLVSVLRITYFGMIFLFIGFVKLLQTYVKSKTNEYSITNRRVIFKFGFLTTDTQEINLDRIEGVKVKQSITDKIVGRGDVIVNGVGMEQVKMCKIAQPMEVRTAILETMAKFMQASNR